MPASLPGEEEWKQGKEGHRVRKAVETRASVETFFRLNNEVVLEKGKVVVVLRGSIRVSFEASDEAGGKETRVKTHTVSYTHLTLPTN